MVEPAVRGAWDHRKTPDSTLCTELSHGLHQRDLP